MSESDKHSFELLADYCGIQSEYLDYRKELTEIPASCRRAVLECMGYSCDDDAMSDALAQIESEQWQRVLPRTAMLREGDRLCLELRLPEARLEEHFELCAVKGEAGLNVVPSELDELERARADSTSYSRRRLDTDWSPGRGRHLVELRDAQGRLIAATAILVVPRTCFQPSALARGEKIFGVSMQLYGVRSARNWGMGDFTDLANFAGDAAEQGIDIVGLNPLHALFPANPLHISPYSPSNRSFFNVMYIDPEAVPEFASCIDARRRVDSPEFQTALAGLRATDRVDYAGVARHKLPILELLFEEFVARHLDTGSERAQEYRAFVERQGEPLRLHAVYDALHEHFFTRDFHLWGWPVWPEEYRDPQGDTVRRFAAEHAKRVEYFQYLQWCAKQQLQVAQQSALAAGMQVGIYLDLAVGVDQSGSEAWANQSLYCLKASAGAPPDALAREGQSWGFPPFDPLALRDAAYEPFAVCLRANMEIAGAVRFDHAVALLRLWWVPRGSSAAGGAYVSYPLEDLLGVLALESQANSCLVIGEDLGTVPKVLTQVMHENKVYSYRVLYFEKDDAGEQMIVPSEYPHEAIAAITTHDLPTLASWWDSSDLDLRASLGLLGTEEIIAELRAGRAQDRELLLGVMRETGLWQDTQSAAEIDMTPALNEAVHAFLASSESAIMISQLEDWLQMLSPVNVPGTYDEYPNWQRKLDQPIEGLFDRPDVQSMLATVRRCRLDL